MPLLSFLMEHFGLEYLSDYAEKSYILTDGCPDERLASPGRIDPILTQHSL